ncbi:OLC1v1006578C2 [Oldenlandia corymbosa var. corymbosa]|uniref:OLC1v1006578C2 n=1 Tax=Oldenlandia corymbosa var. corymbosa TaxID=529605 RepID=A0AAV1DJZ0_OLDCO|nr:OLC1v1006578C2 [Oldenlandia corymbosa var. corymbosa]
MESLSIGGLGISAASPPWRKQKYPRTRNSSFKSIFCIPNSSSTCEASHFLHSNSISSTPRQLHETPQSEIPVCQSSNLDGGHSFLHLNEIFVASHVSFFSMGFFFPLPCFALEGSSLPTEEVSNKINLEAIVVSIDDFFNKYPFFVAGVTFIWLFVIPLVKGYLRKYKFISAIDAFRKLRDDPTCQLLDIRDKKSLDFLNSPNLKILDKNALQVEFREGDEESFAKQVMGSFKEPGSTSLCILDNFDGNSLRVAELLVEKGFKEAYAIKGGIRGKKGWQEIQETLLPPSTHIYPKKKVRESKEPRGTDKPKASSDPLSAETNIPDSRSEETNNGSIKNLSEVKSGTKCVPRSSSPYPNYPDLKPPSSPTPSKPQ